MPNADPNTVDVSTDGGIVTARVTTPAVEERQATVILQAVKAAIGKAGEALRFVVLDLDGVEFMNSSGLAACVELRNGAFAVGAPTILYRPQKEVDQVFRMLKLDRLYSFASSREELERLVSES